MRRGAVAIMLTVMLMLSGCLGSGSDEIELFGFEYRDPPEAPGFNLTNQHGEPVSLPDFEGKVVVVAFVYTHCPDVCPVISSNLAWVDANLGDYSDEVILLSVTIDPARDTVSLLANWTETRGYDWDHLTGNHTELELMWEAWHVGVDDEHIENSTSSEEAGNESEDGLHDDYTLGHSIVTFILDKDTRKRVAYSGTDWNIEEFLHDIQALADE